MWDIFYNWLKFTSRTRFYVYNSMFLFASNLLTLIFSYTACCSNFYLQFFVLFWNVQIKFRSLHFHWIQIFCGQVTYLYCSVDFIGRFIPWFIEGGMYIIYIITIVKNIVKLLCQNMHWKFLNFKRKMNCMTAIDLKLFVNYLTFYWIILWRK